MAEIEKVNLNRGYVEINSTLTKVDGIESEAQVNKIETINGVNDITNKDLTINIDNIPDGINSKVLTSTQQTALVAMIASSLQNLTEDEVTQLQNIGSNLIANSDWARVSSLSDITTDNWSLLTGLDILAKKNDIAKSLTLSAGNYSSTDVPLSDATTFNIDYPSGVSGATVSFNNLLINKINKGDGTASVFITGSCSYYGVDQTVTVYLPDGLITSGGGTMNFIEDSYTAGTNESYSLTVSVTSNQLRFNRSDALSDSSDFQFMIIGNGTW